MRAVIMGIAAGIVGTIAGFAIGRFVSARRGLAALLATLAPLLIYVWFFLASDKPDSGTSAGWFITGLLFVSPIMVPWMVCVPLGYRMGRAGQTATDQSDVGS